MIVRAKIQTSPANLRALKRTPTYDGKTGKGVAMSIDLLKGRAAFDFAGMAERSTALVCFGLLGTACALASLVFACAAPFAAFAVVAAGMLPGRSALIAVGAAWLINQAIGFGLLKYPVDVNTMLWGAVILIAALASTLAASAILRYAHGNRIIALGIAFVAAFAAYELILLAATPVLGGHEAFAPSIVARIAGLNTVWLAGLIIASEILRMLCAKVQKNALLRG
jgi:hypothetical protein